ncbi:ATP-binding protein [Schaalia odontolytica]
MIILAGVHGVGKSYLCERLQQELGILTYAASTLIASYKECELPKDKLTKDINDNQQHLIKAIETIKATTTKFILDAHFCLHDENGNIVRIHEDVFVKLKPKAILLLTDDPHTIAKRRKERDGAIVDTHRIETHQQAEYEHSLAIATKLNIPHQIYKVKEAHIQVYTFIKNLY